MLPKGIPVAVRQEPDVQFQELNGILEQRIQRLKALVSPTHAALDMTEAAPAADFTLALEEPASGSQPQEPV